MFDKGVVSSFNGDDIKISADSLYYFAKLCRGNDILTLFPAPFVTYFSVRIDRAI